MLRRVEATEISLSWIRAVVAAPPCFGATAASFERDGPADERHDHGGRGELDEQPEQLCFCFPAHIASRLIASSLCQNPCDLSAPGEETGVSFVPSSRNGRPSCLHP